LRVEDQPVVIESVSDPTDPGQRVQFALCTAAFGLLVGRVAERDDNAAHIRSTAQWAS
jgi:hypothetical protein